MYIMDHILVLGIFLHQKLLKAVGNRACAGHPIAQRPCSLRLLDFKDPRSRGFATLGPNLGGTLDVEGMGPCWLVRLLEVLRRFIVSVFLCALVMGPCWILVRSALWGVRYIVRMYWGPDEGPILGDM